MVGPIIYPSNGYDNYFVRHPEEDWRGGHFGVIEDAYDDIDDARDGFNPKKVFFERDNRLGENGEELTGAKNEDVVKTQVLELLKNDPDFKAAFEEAELNGVRVQFRFNADENRATLINGDVLQIDIRGDADVAKELKKVFNKDSEWDVVPPGKGASFEEVMSDKDMTGKDFVANMERLGIFSFSGKHGNKLGKDVIYMYDNSAFMKKVIRETLQKQDGKEKFNFSTIGHGGGTISAPFDGFTTSVAAEDLYDGVSDEEYLSKNNLNNVGLMAHEMVHSFLGMGDNPAMDIAEEIFSNELGVPDLPGGPAAEQGMSAIGYQKDLLGYALNLDSDFDVDAFMKAARGGGLDKLTIQEILDRFGGGKIGLEAAVGDAAAILRDR